jgi:hypothetical protein
VQIRQRHDRDLGAKQQQLEPGAVVEAEHRREQLAGARGLGLRSDVDDPAAQPAVREERANTGRELTAVRRLDDAAEPVAQIDLLVAPPVVDAHGLADPVGPGDPDEAGDVGAHARQIGDATGDLPIHPRYARHGSELEGHRYSISSRSTTRSTCSIAMSLPFALRLGPVIFVGHAP